MKGNRFKWLNGQKTKNGELEQMSQFWITVGWVITGHLLFTPVMTKKM